MAFLYVTEQGAVIQRRGRRLVVAKDGQVLADIPALRVEGVLIFGNVQFTTQAVRLMFELEIEMALFSSKGKLLGQLTSPAPKNISLRMTQYARASDTSFIMDFSRIVISAKISNCLEFIRQFGHNHPEEDFTREIGAIEEILRKINGPDNLSGLLGLEGSAAKTYFSAFGKMVRHSFNFYGRKKHPPPDPVNALLSLGYTLVYNEISSLLDGIGFDPYLGLMHRPRFGHAGLASDLCEEFRTPLTDRLTLHLINNRILQADDFAPHAASKAVYLTPEGKKRYFGEYEKFITRPFPMANGTGEMDFRRLFMKQAERLRDALTAGTTYEPFEFSW